MMLQTENFGTLSSEEDVQQLLYEHEKDYQSDAPALYVGTYGKYNAGSIDGLWVDLTTFGDYDEFREFCRILHRDERDPELMFQDYENFPEEWYSESGMDARTFDRILEYASCDNREAADAFVCCFGAESFSKERFEELYMGEWDSEEDFAEHIFYECYDTSYIPQNILYYMDFKAFARDLFYGGDFLYSDGHVFKPC